ncbi:MAG TPA: hypothetical protein VII20_09610 [Roseiarcus sp.]
MHRTGRDGRLSGRRWIIGPVFLRRRRRLSGDGRGIIPGHRVAKQVERAANDADQNQDAENRRQPTKRNAPTWLFAKRGADSPWAELLRRSGDAVLRTGLPVFIPGSDRRHALWPIRRKRRQHGLKQRAHRSINVGKIGYGTALFDDLDLRAAHIDGAPAQGFGEHQAKTVNIGSGRNVATCEPQLFRRYIIIFAGEPPAKKRALAGSLRTGDAKIDYFGAPRIVSGKNNIVR